MLFLKPHGLLFESQKSSQNPSYWAESASIRIHTMLKGGRIGPKFLSICLRIHNLQGIQIEKHKMEAFLWLNIRGLMCDYLGLSSQTQAFATRDANVCNPVCKRLHPGSQTFISIGIGLFLTLNLCPLELTKMISGVKICTPNTQKSPSREVQR